MFFERLWYVCAGPVLIEIRNDDSVFGGDGVSVNRKYHVIWCTRQRYRPEEPLNFENTHTTRFGVTTVKPEISFTPREIISPDALQKAAVSVGN